MEQSLATPLMGPTSEAGIAAQQFDDLVRAHQARIYRVLWCELRDRDAAATLTQECFLRAYQNRAGFRGRSSVGTWLIRIALNLALDYRRNRRSGFWRSLFGRTRTELDTVAAYARDHAPSAERGLIARQELDAVMRLVASLTQQQRTVFMLRFVEELSLEEIAQVMGLEQGTVKTHLSRAVSALRRHYKQGNAK
jgi:RNA polymerase sigma-70 factor (ECF subfamily)